MDQDTINSYQSGGALYQQVAAQYGTAAANAIASAALTGDQSQVNTAFANNTTGGQLLPASATSTADVFVNQLETNPLGAPLSGLNNVLSNTFSSFFSSPAVLATVAVVVFFMFGGAGIIKKWFSDRS